jgi:hypothetical protein
MDAMIIDHNNIWEEEILLLSVDWFFPYWEIFGLIFDVKQKNIIQGAARKSIKKFMQNTEIFWYIARADSDYENRSSQFTKQLASDGLKPKTIDRLFSSLIEITSKGTHVQSITQSVFSMITDLIKEKDSNYSLNNLNSEIASHFISSLDKYSKSDLIDFELINLSSNSTWDKYIRNLTPDLPTLLSDRVSISMSVNGEFKKFWCTMIIGMKPSHVKELLNWYVTSAKQFGDPSFVPQIPTWMCVEN